ncbi:dienelactone hydrolase family protein [candidate division WOR-3 bacterium]|nr:dienelactone hydrolase family protein [candidate division WOR-3 bacterium]
MISRSVLMKSSVLIRSCVFLIVLGVGLAYAADVEDSFSFDGRTRYYLLHVPSTYDGSEPLPLVINLHWGDGTPQGMVSFCGMNPKADEEGFFIVYPAGTIIPAGFTCWNAGPCFETDVDDVGFISALVDTLTANYKIDTLRIFATGFCGGAMMVHRLACELSERLAAVAPVMGCLVVEDWNSCQPERLIPIMHIHARKDPSVPYYGRIWQGIYENYYWAPIDSVMRHWVQVLGCSLDPDTFTNEKGALRQTWSRADSSCEVVFWTTEDDDKHRWPGTVLGSQQLVANDEIWDFFSSHPMPIEEPGVEEDVFSPVSFIDITSPGITNQSGSIRFSLEKSEYVKLEVFDILGRKEITLLDRVLEKGEHSVEFCIHNSGIYFYRLQTPSFSETRILRLIR